MCLTHLIDVVGRHHHGHHGRLRELELGEDDSGRDVREPVDHHEAVILKYQSNFGRDELFFKTVG